jgi:hypothetical protein
MDAHPDLTLDVIHGLGWFYLLVSLMNAVWTYNVYQSGRYYQSIFGFQHVPRAGVWALYTILLFLVAIVHLVPDSDPSAFMFRLPVGFKNVVDWLIANPISYFALSIVLFVAMILLRSWWTRPTAAWLLLNAAMLFLGISMTDYDFRQIVGKPDRWQAGQCSDRGYVVHCRLLHVGVFCALGRERSPDRRRAAEAGRRGI